MNHVFSVAPLLESCFCLSHVAHIAARIEAVTYTGKTFRVTGVLKQDMGKTSWEIHA
jgi:hypothetical protein